MKTKDKAKTANAYDKSVRCCFYCAFAVVVPEAFVFRLFFAVVVVVVVVVILKLFTGFAGAVASLIV